MRATRDLLRRRIPLVRQRAALLTHSQQPHRPYTLPERGKTRAYQANRDGVAERFAEPAGQTSLAVDLARSRSDAHLLNDVELTMVNTAQHHAPHTFSRRPAVPGIGTILRLVMLSTIHAIARFPRGQDCVSSGRVVTWAKAAAGKRSGPSSTTIGKASVQWAFAEAVVLFLRDHPAGQKSLARLEKKHGPGKACTVLAQHVARAVYALVTRETVCDRATCLHREGSGGGAPAASLGPDGISRETVLCQDASTASLHA